MTLSRKSIHSIFINNMLVLSLVSIGLWSAIWIYGEISAFEKTSLRLREQHIENQKRTLQNEVAGIVKYLRYMKTRAEKNIKRTLQNRVNEAHAIAANIHEANHPARSAREIGAMIKDALRPVRFNNGRGYYFAVSMDGIEQLYPVRPEFEGQNLMDLRDSKGNYVIQDEIRIIKTAGQGFVTDYWTKPDASPDRLFPKISFVKYFEPLDWYFGAGEYLDDAKKQIQDEVLNRVADLRFGTEGYFFGSTFQGDPLFSNGKITRGGNNIWELTDPNGVKIIQAQQKAAENPNGGFVRYAWPKLGAPGPFPKISFVMGIPEWKWTIGAGVYLDVLEQEIAAQRAALNKGLREKIRNSAVVLAALVLLILFWSGRMGRQLRASIHTFSLSLRQSTSENLQVDTKGLKLDEFREIAHITNQMLKDRKIADQARARSEERFRLAMEATRDGLWDWDINTGGIYFSPGYSAMLGYSEAEIEANTDTWKKLLHPDDREMVFKANQDLIKQRIPDFEIEYRMQKKDGSWLWIRGWGKVLGWDENGRATRMIGTNTDITARKEAEIAKRKLASDLRQAHKMESIGTLAGGIAHDFNNILGIMIGNAELAMDTLPPGSPVAEKLDRIKTAGLRAKDVVSQLLSFSRRSEPRKRHVDLVAVMQEALRLLTASTPASIEIITDFKGNAPMIKADPTQIQQVVINLCSNAVHAMEDAGGTLKIEVSRTELKAPVKVLDKEIPPGSYARIRVRDTGPGIPADIRDRIFDPYFTTKEVGKGSGMGLSIVHGIIMNHGGAVQLESIPGSHTTITVLLPITGEDAPAPALPESSQPLRGSERILLIDDEPSVLEMSEQLLKRLGYQVVSLTRPEEALALFEEAPNRFDLVISDMTMPGMTGDILAQKMKKIRADIPILICTGFSEKISPETAVEMGIRGVLMKPATKHELAVGIRKALD